MVNQFSLNLKKMSWSKCSEDEPKPQMFGYKFQRITAL